MSDCCNDFEFVGQQNSFDMAGGIRGADGVTFYPHVSADGVLSWTNDGGKQNPAPVNIKGADGTSAYAAAQAAGFTGTEAEFNAYLSGIGDLTQEVADQKSVLDDLTALVDRKAGMLVDTASGSIASFVPDSTVPDMLGVSVAVEPVQDLHGQESPWPGGGGKNICPIATMSTTNGGYIDASTGIVGAVVAGTQYTLSFKNNTPSTANISVRMRVDGAWVTLTEGNLVAQGTRAYTFTPSNSGDVSLSANLGTNYAPAFSDIQLETGSTATAYAPYSNECPISGWDAVSIWNKPTHATSADPTVTIQLGQTVYGGPLDVTGGTMTVDRVIIDCASITTWAIDKSAKRIYKIMSELAPASGTGVVADGLICNRFKSITANQIYANVEGVAISTGSALQFRINGLTDNPDVTLADVNSYFTANETKVVAKLATPITIQLDPVTISTISGQTNNVWADAGDVTVEYAADIKAYIDRMSQPTEDDMIANTLIAANKYFTVNNRLFLSTASIAAGAQIIPGTNCTETSLVEALNALNA